jgi:hypothetical protein
MGVVVCVRAAHFISHTTGMRVFAAAVVLSVLWCSLACAAPAVSLRPRTFEPLPVGRFVFVCLLFWLLRGEIVR